jgi:DNA-binding MarR family transcriptional regulator
MDGERDHVDRFLEEIRDELPELDFEVEGIVERLSGLQRRFRRALEETLSEFGLSVGEWHVLGALHRSGNRSPGNLAAEFELSSGAMTNRLDRLEERGLIRRRPDPDDRRAVRVEPTAAGMRVYERAVGAQAQKEALIAAALNEREKRQLNALLRRLMVEFERREGPKKR